MTVDWIICERGGRWTPALRCAIERDSTDGPRHRIRELRHLAEIDGELTERPSSILGIEVHSGNFAAVLDWLAMTNRDFPQVPCIALCDRALSDPQIAVALREAGALEVTPSPRRLKAILELGRRHAKSAAGLVAADDESGPLSLTKRAWDSLPWQDA